jgi:hypothetical protein
MAGLFTAAEQSGALAKTEAPSKTEAWQRLTS